MSDFNEDVENKPKRWIAYYGTLAHADNDCPELEKAKTLRRARTARDPCPQCVETANN